MKKIAPASRLRGDIELPGDKSISIRALLFGALAEGTSSITGLGTGEDVRSAAHCLERLGIQFDWKSPSRVDITGEGLFRLKQPSGDLNAGNSGTTLRLLTGILAGQHFTTTITGDSSLCSRPMRRITEPLRKMGAFITGRESGLYAPLTIHGRPLKGITYQSPVASAQVKSCILFAGLHAEGETTVTEPYLSRDHTERMLKHFGVPVEREGTSVTVSAKPEIKASPVSVPGDISSAAFFIAAALVVPDSRITIRSVGINPTRTGILEVVEMMGGSVEITNRRVVNQEPVADLIVTSSELHGITLSGDMIPKVIDEIPILAVVAAKAKGTTVIRDAEELRVKETDRITSVVRNLKAMGARIEERKDGMIIQGEQSLKGAPIICGTDHRIVMAFTIAGLIAMGITTLDAEEWADVSLPGFFDVVEMLQQ